jgi:hypothetical protein
MVIFILNLKMTIKESCLPTDPIFGVRQPAHFCASYPVKHFGIFSGISCLSRGLTALPIVKRFI